MTFHSISRKNFELTGYINWEMGEPRAHDVKLSVFFDVEWHPATPSQSLRDEFIRDYLAQRDIAG